jgi:hypothetical protein
VIDLVAAAAEALEQEGCPRAPRPSTSRSLIDEVPLGGDAAAVWRRCESIQR